MTRSAVVFIALGFLQLVNADWARVEPTLAEGTPHVPQAASEVFTQRLRPWMEQYCYRCHGNGKQRGGVSLDRFADLAAAVRDPKTWELVWHSVEGHKMPPKGSPQPRLEERQFLVEWIATAVLTTDCEHPDPGRVTIRRLNRVEYNNSIRDLVGVPFHPADDFPADDLGYGFDNIGDVLSLPPVLLEKYLAAADRILDAAIIRNGEPPAEAHRRIFFRQPTPETKLACAREIIGQFARRAYRRPVTSAELDGLIRLFNLADRDGNPFEESVKLALKAVLVSPHFLFRGEEQSEPENPQAIHRLDEFALASRLSYFLWSSLPDDALFAEAERGQLRQHWEAQVRRLLADPKSQALVEDFAGQWLQLRNLKLATPDASQFPAFDEALRIAMQRETELFIEGILRQDRSVLEIIDTDYTFLNERLARHYGVEGVRGEEFRRVQLTDARRGGVLTHASILTLTSNPTRTSPVKRGKWVLENLLGTPPPPPPPGVPPLDEAKTAALSGSLRQRMEQHRANPLCASCHETMDAIGFGLENFDGLGAWRTRDGLFDIDPSGTLPGGQSFEGPAELKRVFLKRQDQFVRCLSEKMLTYALGRGLEYYDRCAVDQIASELTRNHYRFSSLVLAVVKSAPFQLRRGEENRPGP